jgi:hypothetical protein
MVNNKIFLIIVLVAVVALVAYFASVRWIAAAPAAPQQNASAGILNSSLLSAFNGTSAASAASNGTSSLPNETLNGSVTQDQNYSVLSTGNIIQSP